MVKNQLLFKGVLRPIILDILLNNNNVYGYHLIKKVNEISKGKLVITEGALYPLLNKLEVEGIIKGVLDQGTNRKKRIYELTAIGKIHTQIELENYKDFIKMLNSILF